MGCSESLMRVSLDLMGFLIEVQWELVGLIGAGNV
jgi:hypothetical protein